MSRNTRGSWQSWCAGVAILAIATAGYAAHAGASKRNVRNVTIRGQTYSHVALLRWTATVHRTGSAVLREEIKAQLIKKGVRIKTEADLDKAIQVMGLTWNNDGKLERPKRGRRPSVPSADDSTAANKAKKPRAGATGDGDSAHGSGAESPDTKERRERVETSTERVATSAQKGHEQESLTSTSASIILLMGALEAAAKEAFDAARTLKFAKKSPLTRGFFTTALEGKFTEEELGVLFEFLSSRSFQKFSMSFSRLAELRQARLADLLPSFALQWGEAGTNFANVVLKAAARARETSGTGEAPRGAGVADLPVVVEADPVRAGARKVRAEDSSVGVPAQGPTLEAVRDILDEALNSPDAARVRRNGDPRPDDARANLALLAAAIDIPSKRPADIANIAPLTAENWIKKAEGSRHGITPRGARVVWEMLSKEIRKQLADKALPQAKSDDGDNFYARLRTHKETLESAGFTANESYEAAKFMAVLENLPEAVAHLEMIALAMNVEIVEVAEILKCLVQRGFVRERLPSFQGRADSRASYTLKNILEGNNPTACKFCLLEVVPAQPQAGQPTAGDAPNQ